MWMLYCGLFLGFTVWEACKTAGAVIDPIQSRDASGRMLLPNRKQLPRWIGAAAILWSLNWVAVLGVVLVVYFLSSIWPSFDGWQRMLLGVGGVCICRAAISRFFHYQCNLLAAVASVEAVVNMSASSAPLLPLSPAPASRDPTVATEALPRKTPGPKAANWFQIFGGCIVVSFILVWDLVESDDTKVVQPVATNSQSDAVVTAHYWKAFFYGSTLNEKGADNNNSQVATESPDPDGDNSQLIATFRDLITRIKTTDVQNVDAELVSLNRDRIPKFERIIVLLKRYDVLMSPQVPTFGTSKVVAEVTAAAEVSRIEEELDLLVEQMVAEADRMQGRLSERYKGQEFPIG